MRWHRTGTSALPGGRIIPFHAVLRVNEHEGRSNHARRELTPDANDVPRKDRENPCPGGLATRDTRPQDKCRQPPPRAGETQKGGYGRAPAGKTSQGATRRDMSPPGASLKTSISESDRESAATSAATRTRCTFRLTDGDVVTLFTRPTPAVSSIFQAACLHTILVCRF